jgi:carboxymethylenebutenolidase
MGRPEAYVWGSGMIEAHSHIGANTSWVDLGKGTRAFLAIPTRFRAPYPAIVLGHERYGLVQHTLDLAAKFASYGYVAVAPDMASHFEGDKEALNRGDVGLTLTDEQTQGYMAQGMDYLKTVSQVNPARIAAMGVCQSGGYPHLLNSIRPDVAANIVFYGGVRPKDEVIASLTAPTLGVFGEADHTISIKDVYSFRAKLEEHRKNYDIKLWPSMPHGWLNDTMPGRYRQKEAEEAWTFLMDFLDRVYAGGYPADRVRWRMAAEYSRDYDFSKNVRLA